IIKLRKDVYKTISLWEREYKKGFTAYMILLFLLKEKKYGYQITTDLCNMTNNKVLFKESAVYQILKKLRKKKFVVSEWAKSKKGPNRKYYRITKSGKELVKDFSKEFIIPINKGMQEQLQLNFDLKKMEEN
ncbi:MAG: PadR family transcriptional regulator, partial [Candidatus Cloacimonadota bacterium]|nr:PadR family transcriptional regulator [Candidatus Cloacimonadota bacterium]